MYAREQRVLLRHYLEQGLSKAEIARSLGVSRRTLYYWIDSGQLTAAWTKGRCATRRGRLYRARSIGTGRSSRRGWPSTELSATRLLEEIRAAGYTGGYSQVKEYVREVRPIPPSGSGGAL